MTEDYYPAAAIAVLKCKYGHKPEHQGDANLKGVVRLRPDRDNDRNLIDHCERKLRLPPRPATKAEEELSGDYSGAVTRLADATKWLFAAAGGVAVVLLAGIQFSGIGKASGAGRNVAVFLTGLALFTVGAALVIASSVLVSRKSRLSELFAGTVDRVPPGTEITAVKELERLERFHRRVWGSPAGQHTNRASALLGERKAWRRLGDAGDTRAEHALNAIDTRLRNTVAQAEYLDVELRFRWAQRALLTAAATVFAAAVVSMSVLAGTPTVLAPKDAVPVRVVLTQQGKTNYQGIAGQACTLPTEPPAGALVPTKPPPGTSVPGPSPGALVPTKPPPGTSVPEPSPGARVAAVSGALVAGTPGQSPVVVLTDTGDPDCDGHRMRITSADGNVVPEAGDALPEVTVAPGTSLKVILNEAGVAAFQEQAHCALPKQDSYDAIAITGFYGKAMLMALTDTRSTCDGRSFKWVPAYGWAHPLASKARS